MHGNQCNFISRNTITVNNLNVPKTPQIQKLKTPTGFNCMHVLKDWQRVRLAVDLWCRGFWIVFGRTSNFLRPPYEARVINDWYNLLFWKSGEKVFLVKIDRVVPRTSHRRNPRDFYPLHVPRGFPFSRFPYNEWESCGFRRCKQPRVPFIPVYFV